MNWKIGPKQTRAAAALTGRERSFPADRLIVSKTDEKGRITYANSTFIEISGFAEDELIGAPHAIVRHPEMPRAFFRLVWERIASGEEIFGYVVNRCPNGDHYWVFAHLTPSLDPSGRIKGFHSTRRRPSEAGKEAVKPLYAELCRIERESDDRKAGLTRSYDRLTQYFAAKATSYDRFILTS